jgi:hypothetical protein
MYRAMVTANQYGVSMAAGLVTVAIGAAAMLLVFAFIRVWDRKR